MKTRFSTVDIAAIVPEIHNECKGLRVSQVYSLSNKSFLIRLGKQAATDGTEEIEDGGGGKLNLLLESGCRLHLTEYDWPKESAPNGFAMKLRKHLKNRRLEMVRQLGLDRIVQLQFGTGEAAYHLIVELYDKGNIMITDYAFTILNVLRPRKLEDEEIKFIVREVYPIDRFLQNNHELPTLVELQEVIDKAQVGDNLRRIFNPKMSFGPALLEHAFIECGFSVNCRITKNERPSAEKVLQALKLAQETLLAISTHTKGVIIQRREQIFFKSDALKSLTEQVPESKTIVSYQEFHPMLFAQHRSMPTLDSQTDTPEVGRPQQVLQLYSTFNMAVDQFFSNIESQKFDQKTLQQEKDALKKLENVRKDHERRLLELEKRQEEDNRKGALIEMNLDLVERALLVIRSAIASQMSWEDLRDMIREAQTSGDQCAGAIHSLKLDQNRFVMLLNDPYEPDNENASKVDIDLELSAYANARKYFDERKLAKKKEDKTIEASSKALKNAQIKTAQTLKDVQLKSAIIKARKVLWFEKFFWFISSDNYVVISGRDAQQNELIVKRYFKAGDVYVHADLHGGSTVVVKNLNSKNVIPSRTLEEAGVMAICYSNAWESKVPCRAWWVHHHQVSKTAPSGEYLTVGSFMIRGKKNYLPLSQLVLGFSFLFRLGDDSIAKHAEQQKIKVLNEQPIVESVAATSETVGKSEDEEDEPSAFPNTKVTIKSEEVQLLESSGTRMKVQKIERKQKQTVQRIANFVKPQQMPTTKTKPGNKKSNKSKKKKNGDWSDDEDGADHAKLKLLRKLKKGDRLLDLQEQLKINEEEANVNEQETEEEKDVDSTANVVSNKEEAENVDIEEIVTSTNVNLQLDESDDEDDVAKGEDVTAEQDQKTTGKSDQLADKEAEEEEEEEEQTEEKKSEEYQRLIGSLTGQPLPDDEMLYLIPVVGPYTSMQNNKFKVKILPGTSKRGKTSKTALHLFSVDKQTNGREKELFRSIRDQDVARNLPNKVKLVAQNLHAVKKKK